MSSEDDWDPSEDSESDFDIEKESDSGGEDGSDLGDEEEGLEPSPKKRKALTAAARKSPAKTKTKAGAKVKSAAAAAKAATPKPSPNKKTVPSKRKTPADDEEAPEASPSPAKKAKVPVKPSPAISSSSASGAISKKSADPADNAASLISSKAPPKVKSVTGKSAEELVLQYVISANRPYSSNLLYENLHGAVGKTLLGKILDKFAETGELRAKAWGKTKLYWPNQDQYEDSNNPETLAQLDHQIAEAQQKVVQVKREVDVLDGEVKHFQSQPSDSDADREIAALEKDLAAKKVRLEKLTASKVLLTKDQVAKISEQFKNYFKHWKTRRAATNEILGLILENVSKTKKKLISDLGLETEEDQGIDYAEYLDEFRKA